MSETLTIKSNPSQESMRPKSNALWRDKEALSRTLRSLIPFIGLVFILVFFQVTSDGRFLMVRNLRTVFDQAFPIIIGSCGMLFVIAQGNIDFSMGSVAGMAAIAGAMLCPFGPLVALLAAVAVGAAIGAINGFAHVGFKAPSTIVTLCTQFTFRGVIQALVFTSLAVPLSWSWLDGMGFKIAVGIVVLLLTVVVFAFAKFGKYSKAIGSGGAASIQSGVPLNKMKIWAFVISGIAAGLCGYFGMIRSGSVATTTGAFLEMNVLLALVLGGLPLSGGSDSKVRVVLTGSAMLAFLMNGLIIWGINDSMQQGVKGVIFLIAVALSFERDNIAVIK